MFVASNGSGRTVVPDGKRGLDAVSVIPLPINRVVTEPSLPVTTDATVLSGWPSAFET